MQVAVLLCLLSCLVLLNYRLSRSVLYPPFVFSAMWLMVISIYQLNLIEVDTVHSETFAIIGSGAVLFSFGGVIAKLLPSYLFATQFTLVGHSRWSAGSRLVRYALMAAAFAGMLLLAHNTLAAGASGVGGTFLERARSGGIDASQNGDTSSFSVLAYISIWITCAAIIFMVERRDRSSWIMALIAFVTAIFTTGRGPILLLFSALTAVYLIEERKLTLRSALKFARLPILLFFVLYVGLIFTNKNTSTVSGGFVGIIIFFVVGYIVGPMAALDYVLQHASQYASEPQHTFKFLLEVASKLHLVQYTPPPMLDVFIAVPFPTNVYTGYKFFFTDFGFVGCLVIVTIIGFLQTALYRKAISGSALGLYFFAFTVFPLVMFVFDDVYSAIGQDLNVFLFGWIYLTIRPIRLLPVRAESRRQVAIEGTLSAALDRGL